ncbi:MAG: PKD domain-containing protein [Bacteroidia bacterium]
MKNLVPLLIIFLGASTWLQGQAYKSYHDDFESYTVNSWLAQSSPAWTTWSGVHGSGGDDVEVTNSDAASGTKSIYFNAGPGPEDVVLPFGGEYTRGQFLFSANFKVPVNKSAYFNFQADVTTGVTWAMEVNMETDGDIIFSNLTSGTMFSATIPNDRWFEIKLYVHLSVNRWHVYIDGEYLGYFSNAINRIASLDLYPVDNNSSFWVDDVSFIYAPPSPDNAGIMELTRPLKPTPCGDHDLKVNVQNNGNNRLDSVEVHWTLDGVSQTPVNVTTAIDTPGSSSGHELEVTLGTNISFGSTPRDIKVWTVLPNGVADTINFDDTLETSVTAVLRGTGITRESPFQGRTAAGTASSPDTVCVGDTLTYGISPPTGFTNADLGTDWIISNLEIERNPGIPPVDTVTLPPTSNTNARLRYVADTSEANELFKMEITVELTSVGCDTVLTHYFFVAPVPVADFSVSDVCDRDLVIFTNNTTGPGTMTYRWDFGNNSSSTFQNPIRVYSTPGTYQVELEATNSFGCMSSIVKPVTVHPDPVVGFSAIEACDGLPVMFTDTTSIASGSVTDYRWDFGGDTSVLQNPTYLFDSAGTFDVKLRATSDKGCTGQVTRQVNVFEVPEADFSAANVCESDSVSFADASGFSGTGLTYSWDFGDGSSSGLRNPTHHYATSGIYLVTQITTSPDGCADTTTKNVEVYPDPVASFSIASGHCFGDSTMFSNSSTVNGGTISSYSWEFGDGNSSSGQLPSHQYSAPGQYMVSLAVMTASGCVDTMTMMTDIYETPEADFTVSDACFGPATGFSNASTIVTGDTLTYEWILGDGNTSTDLDPIHTYSVPGTYNVQLIAESVLGCVDTFSHELEIFEVPAADFTANNACIGDTTMFGNQSQSLSDTMEFVWRFGDGMTSTGMSPDHRYISEGSYDVMLIATTENGCTDSMTMTVEVYPKPDAGFTHAHLGNGLYEFTPNTTGLNSYSWNFGDTTTSNDEIARHRYEDFGSFTVSLIVVNSNGCESTSDVNIDYATGVENTPAVSASINVYPNPYRETTNIVYELEKTSKVLIEVYTMEGKLASRLVNATQQAGEHRCIFSGQESGLSSGSFFIRFTIDGETYMKQIVKAK